MKRIPFHAQSGLVKAALWLVWLLCFALVLVVALKARKAQAQIGVAEQPMFASLLSVTPYPQTIPSIAFYWVASDMPTNVAALSWVDRIVGSIWTNANPSSPVTNTSSGVFFARQFSQFMTNSGATVPGGDNTNTYWVIRKSQPFSGTFEERRFMYTPSGSGMRFGDSDYISGGRFSYGTQPAFVCFQPFSVPNEYVDYCVTCTNISPTTISSSLYTNGVLEITSTACGRMYNGVTWMWLGASTVPDSYFTGYVHEIAIFTNTLSPSVVSNLHYYATNTYKYSP